MATVSNSIREAIHTGTGHSGTYLEIGDDIMLAISDFLELGLDDDDQASVGDQPAVSIEYAGQVRLFDAALLKSKIEDGRGVLNETTLQKSDLWQKLDILVVIANEALAA